MGSVLRLGLLVGFSIHLLAGCAAPPSSNPGIVALTGATLIDGTGASPLPDAVILLEGERIRAVGRRGETTVPPGAVEIDLRGHWLLPGLVDAHAHLPEEAPFQDPILAKLLAFGITALRNPSTAPGAGVELRQRIEAGEVLGPRMHTAGVLIDTPGSFWPFAAVVESEEEIRQEVRRQAALGVDFIKLYAGITPDLAAAGIDEAHRHGLPVIGHLGRTGWAEAARLGIDAVVHCGIDSPLWEQVPESERDRFRDFFLPNPRFSADDFRPWRETVSLDAPPFQEVTAALFEHGVTVDPTLTLILAILNGDDPILLESLEPEFARSQQIAAWRGHPQPYSADWTPEQFAEAENTFPLFLESVRRWHEAGILLSAGSDLENPWITPGVSLHRELELLVQAGIAPLDVLTIATRNGARAAGFDDTGVVEEGRRADLLVLTADPLVDIRNTRRIAAVFLAGHCYPPALLLRQAFLSEGRPDAAPPLPEHSLCTALP